MSKVEHDHVLKEEKFDTMRRDVSEMKNVCTTKSRADVCSSNVVFDSSIMQVMAQTKNVENVDIEQLKKWEQRSKNIFIHRIPKEKLETLPYLAIVIEDFFKMHFSMSGVMVYRPHRVGKQGAPRSRERPIVCTMPDESKQKIILDNS